MRKLAPIISLLVLTSCSGTSLGTMDEKIKFVQDTSVAACSYLPAAASVSQVILATNATLDATLVTIANGICSAVAEWQTGVQNKSIATAMAPCPMVNNICIQGSFVNQSDQKKGP